MTLTEALKERIEGKELHLRNPDVRGTYVFHNDLQFNIITDDGVEYKPPLWPSDLTRKDWFIAPIAED